jgi:hypothetical protein
VTDAKYGVPRLLLISFMLCQLQNKVLKMTDFWNVTQCIQIYIYQTTRRHIPEARDLGIHRRDNLRSHDIFVSGKSLQV